MPTKKLSALAVPTLPPGEWRDAALPGLILRVGARRRTWTFRARVGGVGRRDILGHFPKMSLSAARDAGRELLNRFEHGAPAPTPISHPRSASALTLDALLDRYEKLRLREGHRTKTLTGAMRTLRAGLKPWLGLPVSEFTKADLRAARDAIVERGALMQANRLLAYLGPVLRWAAQEDLIAHNFVGDLRKAPERKRDRVLTRAELVAIWRACDGGPGRVSQAFGRMVRFLLVTAQRRDEAASLCHGDIVKGIWRQTANKADRAHSLALPPLALHLVGQREPQALVFAGGNGKIGGFSKLKRGLDKASGVTDWRLHDLRRSAATYMQELGIQPDVIRAILNHAIAGVSGVYLRAELEQAKATALIAWSAEIERLVAAPNTRAAA
jgi:integrase